MSVTKYEAIHFNFYGLPLKICMNELPREEINDEVSNAKNSRHFYQKYAVDLHLKHGKNASTMRTTMDLVKDPNDCNTIATLIFMFACEIELKQKWQ